MTGFDSAELLELLLVDQMACKEVHMKVGKWDAKTVALKVALKLNWGVCNKKFHQSAAF